MAADQTKLIIEIETLLRGLDKTLRGVGQVRKSLQSVVDVRAGTQQAANINRTAAATERLRQQQERAAITSQRLAQQQQALNVRAQQLANAQTRAQQTTQRLEQAQQRLSNTSGNIAARLGQQADAHVRAFKAIQRGVDNADAHVRFFKASEASLAKAPQLDAHVRAFRALQRGIDNADNHVRFFRANEAALAKAPQLDAHVRAFRALQRGIDDADNHVKFFRANEATLAKAPQLDAHVKAFRAVEAAARRSTQGILSVGNALRSVGQGLASVGATLSVILTAPLVAAGVASVDAAVRLDSLKRGLTAIVGSADEAARQLKRLTDIAKLPGIGFEEAIQGSIRLQAVGFSAGEAEKSLKEFANAIALTGGGREELTRVTVQLGQLAAKGKVLSQDLRPIIEAAPAVGRALLQAFGTVNADDIQELGLSSKEFLGVLTDELGRLPRAAAGAKNSFENFRDEVFRAAAAVGDALLPGLIRLAEVAGPIITTLANAFGKLPQPVQLVAIGLAGLLAAIGPIAFIAGQLTLGVGRLLVGFVELNAAGILPTIASLRAFAAGSLTAAAAQRTLAASTALTLGVLGGVAAVIAAVATAFAVYNAFQKDAVTLSKENAATLTTEIEALEKQVKFLNGLGKGVERTADEQQRLSDIYDKLNTQAQIRVAGITDEEKRLVVLRAELEKLIQLRGQEREQQAANVAAQIAASAATVTANDQSRNSIAARIAANNALVETLEREGRITEDTRRQLEQLGHSVSVDVVTAIENLQNQSARLVARQKELGDNTEETRKDLEGYLEALRALDPRHELTARQLLTLAKNMGLFKGDIDLMVPTLEKYIQTTDAATKSTDAFNRSLSENARQLLAAGDKADDAAKGRQKIIQASAAIARETSVDFAGALKSLRQSVQAVPELRAAFEREKELTGKSLEELLNDALESAFKGRAKDKSGTALRSAQEQLAQSLADVAQASADEQGTIEKLKNEGLLRENENAFSLQLIVYRQYLNERARLTSRNVQLEIDAQQRIADDALAEQQRLNARASRPGLPQPERVKAQAGAAEADEKVIKARTRILDLQQKQREISAEVDQLLRESSKQQLEDTRKLEQEFAELRGSIEAAANAATDEKFREALQQLSLAQDDLNKRELLFGRLLSTEQKEEIALAKARNQRQIDAIESIKTQEDALASLAAANELVSRAKERQAQLEADIGFQVEFRGLSEEAAIARRLAGEEKLNNSLTLAQETIRQIITTLQARGVEPPQALTQFLADTAALVKGLGELSFSEQFRLAQKEFDRLNDERLQKIADVERAVRNRDIAEVEGAIVIRRINGLYTADLEAQLVLLKQIADASSDRGLQRQAADAAETVKDTRDRVAELSQQIETAGKDAFRSGLADFFVDLTDRSQSALEDLLSFVNSIARRLTEVVADSLSQEIFEGLFGGAEQQTGGLIATVKRLFGFGGGDGAGKAAGAVDAVAGKAALEADAVAAATTLQAGATTASVTFSTSVATSAAAFASSIIAAGAAFAASVAAGAGAQQAVGGLGGALGAATGDIIPARPGGVFANIAEAGHAEAVLTTDPRHALRQARILTRFLRLTHGLQGRFPVPQLAQGALVTPRQAEMNLLAGITRTPLRTGNIADMPLAAAGGGGSLRLRQVLVDERNVGDWLNSSEGEQVFRDKLRRNAPIIRQLGGRG